MAEYLTLSVRVTRLFRLVSERVDELSGVGVAQAQTIYRFFFLILTAPALITFAFPYGLRLLGIGVRRSLWALTIIICLCSEISADGA